MTKNKNQIEIFALPDCEDCDKLTVQLTEKKIPYTLVYDKKVEHRAKQLGKCASLQIACNFIENQRKTALRKSGVAANTKYPLVFHNDHYISLEKLEKHDFSNPVTPAIKPAITIYSTGSCWSCHTAKELLRKKNIKFIEKDKKDDPFPEKCGQEFRSAYPKIYIQGKCIGGLDELKTLNQTGQLDRYITPASIIRKPKTTTSKRPIQSKPSTQTTPVVSQEVVISANSLQTLLLLLKPTPDDSYREVVDAQKSIEFEHWLDRQEGPIQQLVTPDQQLVARLVIDSQCPPLLIEVMIRQGLTLDTFLNSFGDSIRGYLTTACPSDYKIKALLNYYSPEQSVDYCHLPPVQKEIKQTCRRELETHAQEQVLGKSKILAISSGVGVLQGFMSALTSLIIPVLEKSNLAKKLPQLRGASLLRFILPALVQACSALALYPILTPTAWRTPEELASLSVQAEALAVYFVSTFANSLAAQLGIHELQQWIEEDSNFTNKTKFCLKTIIPYLDSLDNLLSRLLSYSTYAHFGIETTGFACNQVSRWTSRGLFLFAFHSLKKCFSSSTPASSTDVRQSEEVRIQQIPHKTSAAAAHHKQILPLLSSATTSLSPPHIPQKKLALPPRSSKPTKYSVATSNPVSIFVKKSTTNEQENNTQIPVSEYHEFRT